MAALGDPAGAEAAVRANIALAERLRASPFAVGGRQSLCRFSRMRGDWEALHQHYEEIEKFPVARDLVEWLKAVEMCDRGPLHDGLEPLGAVIGSAPGGLGALYNWGGPILVGAMAAAARAAGDQFHLDIAKAASQELVEVAPKHPRFVHAGEHGLGFVAAARGDATEAARLYPEILERQGTADVLGGFSVDRLLGLLASTTGNTQAAGAHFEDALAFCRKAGYRPELAWTCSDYSDLLLERAATHPSVAGASGQSTSGGSARPEDRAKAVKLQDEALQIARDLGMKPLIERVLRRRQFLKA
jgi:hypothetical protein